MISWRTTARAFKPYILTSWVAIIHASCINTKEHRTLQFSSASTVKYSAHIKPILDKYCIECHGIEGTESGLDLRTLESILEGGESGPSIIKNNPNESLLLNLIEDQLMPPEGEMLRKKQIKTIRMWLRSGASA